MSSTSSQMVQKKLFIDICGGDEERKKHVENGNRGYG